MFSKFSKNKNHYRKGQAFPFLIALLCAVIILIMITVNVGQIGVFRADVSNAADAGGLAAASILSGTLLGLGLHSDMMCGYGLICAAAIIIALLVPGGIVVAAAISGAFAIHQFTERMKATWNAQMGCANAKKSALQYAFQNVGVDEPRPTFRQFLVAIGEDPDNPSNPIALYDEYARTETDRARAHARSGFARFMEDAEEGYWDINRTGFCEISPGNISAGLATNGYGWTQLDDGTIINSYDTGNNYDDYENFVQVTAFDKGMYSSLDYFNFPGQDLVAEAVGIWVAATNYPTYLAAFSFLGPLAPIIALILSALTYLLAKELIKAISFGLVLDEEEEVDRRDTWVSVIRHKREQDLGLWNFRYGNVSARANCRAFRQNGDETIDPTFLDSNQTLYAFLLYLAFAPVGIAYFIDHLDEIFDTEKHIFETELTTVQ